MDYTRSLNPSQQECRKLTVNAAKLGALLLLYDFVFLHYAKNAFLYVYVWIRTGSFTTNAATVNAFLGNKENFASYTAFSMLFSCSVVLITLMLVVLTARLMGIKLLPSLKLKDKGGVKTAFMAFPVAMLLNGIITNICNFLVGFFEKHGTVIPEADFSIDSPNASAVILEILYLVVVAPVAEEFIFRGLVLKTIAPFGKKLAIVTSALLFGLMHGNLTQFLGAFAVGIIFAAVDIKYRSILPSIIIHTLNNILPTIYNIGDAFGSGVIKLIYSVLLYSSMLAGVFILVSNFRNFHLPEEKEHALSAPKRVLTLALNVPLLAYTVYLIYDMIKAVVIANS